MGNSIIKMRWSSYLYDRNSYTGVGASILRRPHTGADFFSRPANWLKVGEGHQILRLWKDNATNNKGTYCVPIARPLSNIFCLMPIFRCVCWLTWCVWRISIQQSQKIRNGSVLGIRTSATNIFTRTGLGSQESLHTMAFIYNVCKLFHVLCICSKLLPLDVCKKCCTCTLHNSRNLPKLYRGSLIVAQLITMWNILIVMIKSYIDCITPMSLWDIYAYISHFWQYLPFLTSIFLTRML